MMVLFQQAIPVVSEHRSIYVAARQLRSDPTLGSLPVAFFEHEDYGAGFWLSGQNVVVFDDDDRHKMTAYLEAQRKVLIVSREEDVEILSRTLKWPLVVTPVQGARRLYLCDERDAETQQPRTAARTWSDLQLLRR
jgi:hypothetical protein